MEIIAVIEKKNGLDLVNTQNTTFITYPNYVGFLFWTIRATIVIIKKHIYI